MSKSRVERFWILLLVMSSVLLLTIAPTFAHTKAELKEIATTDFIPEVREAASQALSQLYLKSDMTQAELEEVVKTAQTANLREAAVPALAQVYGDVSGITTSKEAQAMAKDLEKKATKNENPLIRKAAGMALADYYTAFNLNGVEGYGVKDLEKIAKQGKTEALQNAAVEALAAIYPNVKNSEELKDLIAEAENDNIKKAASQALAIRYAGPFPPTPSLEKLKAMATNPELSKWVRAAAGDAFGKLAVDKLGIEKLTELAKNGETTELRSGAGKALAKALIESQKSEQELLGMVVAASTAETEAYRKALIEALADRYVNW